MYIYTREGRNSVGCGLVCSLLCSQKRDAKLINYCLELMIINLIDHIMLVQLRVRGNILHLMVLKAVACLACWCRGKRESFPSNMQCRTTLVAFKIPDIT